MNKTQEQVVRWLADGATGSSSETMAFYLAFGVKPRNHSYPYDPDDLDRCLQLLAAAPLLRRRLGRMAKVSSGWRALVKRWAEIEACHLDEVGLGWRKARIAPKTYALMKSVIEPTESYL